MKKKLINYVLDRIAELELNVKELEENLAFARATNNELWDILKTLKPEVMTTSDGRHYISFAALWDDEQMFNTVLEHFFPGKELTK